MQQEMKINRRFIRGVTIIAVALAAYAWQGLQDRGPAPAGGDDADRVVAAFEAGRSDQWVQSGGVVERTLADDHEGSRHQRFIVRLRNGHTVLVAHNIDLAPRVPLSRGDRISFRGEYEWNDRGGVIHWTHHDPRGRHDGGWIEYEGKTFR